MKRTTRKIVYYKQQDHCDTSEPEIDYEFISSHESYDTISLVRKEDMDINGTVVTEVSGDGWWLKAISNSTRSLPSHEHIYIEDTKTYINIYYNSAFEPSSFYINKEIAKQHQVDIALKAIPIDALLHMEYVPAWTDTMCLDAIWNLIHTWATQFVEKHPSFEIKFGYSDKEERYLLQLSPDENIHTEVSSFMIRMSELFEERQPRICKIGEDLPADIHPTTIKHNTL